MKTDPSHTDDRDRVRDASDIVRIIGEHLQLKPKGREYVGLCPFHDDHKPSMNVVPQKQIFHCFSCGAGGDVFTFVQKFHKMDFRESLEYLAERAGIALTRRSMLQTQQETDSPAPSPRAAMLRACRSANDFFLNVLKRPDLGAMARGVIASRGLSAETVETFGIGASPDRWDGLLLTLQSRDLDVEPYIAAGLLKRRENGSGLYDAFRNRLMFPIHDQIGRVVAFGARRIDDADEPKYLNSPESSLFDKSSTLYALHLASRAIQRERVAIVTEGYMDAIACHQGGFQNTVATLGTALTRKHAAVLKRLCDTVVLLFDSDDAGQRAADRAIEILLGEFLDVRVATLAPHTTAKDPDELLKQPGGADTFKRVLSGATDLIEFRFARLRARLSGAGLAQLDRAVRDELGRLAELGMDRLDPIRRQLIIRRLAEVTGLDARSIGAAIPSGRAARSDAGSQETAADQLPAKEIACVAIGPAESLVGCLLAEPALWGMLSDEDRDLMKCSAYRWPVIEKLTHMLLQDAVGGNQPGLTFVLGQEDAEGLHAAAISLSQRIEQDTGSDPARLRAHFEGCLLTSRKSRARVKLDSVDDLAARLEANRRARAELGDDMRILPRSMN
ncbi:MAG: DNA primase [Phycisphaeraceae bacterium]|nr:DNA primase [Phycisphaeraceae bacterium]